MNDQTLTADPAGAAPPTAAHAKRTRYASSEATRLLSAGVHLDEGFRRRVLDELRDHPARPVAPSLGFDAVPVLAHALEAESTDRAAAGMAAAGMLLTGVLACFLAAANGCPWTTGLLFPAFAALFCLLRYYAHQVRSGATPDAASALSTDTLQTVAAPLLRYASRLFAAWCLLRWCVTVDVSSALILLLLLVTSAFSATAYREHRRTWALETQLARDSPTRGSRNVRALSRVHSSLLAHIDREQFGQLVVYEPSRPFAGLGVPHKPWSFVVELKQKKTVQPAGGAPPAELTAAEVIDLIEPELTRLRKSATTGRDRLRGLEVDRCVYLPAGLSRHALAAEHAPPVLDAHLRGAVDDGAEGRRFFLRIRVGAWEEQIVTTILVRAHTQGGMLVLEVVPHVLTPVRPEFHQVDAVRVRPLRFGKFSLWRSLLFTSPLTCGALAVSAGRDMAASVRRRQVAPVRVLPTGPLVSVRELGATPDTSLFEDMDVSRYIRTVQDRIVSGVRTALRSRGYDLAEFEQQVINVSGGGVYIGGSFSGGAVATAANAKAHHGDSHQSGQGKANK